jgi:hypothetical protein
MQKTGVESSNYSLNSARKLGFFSDLIFHFFSKRNGGVKIKFCI